MACMKISAQFIPKKYIGEITYTEFFGMKIQIYTFAPEVLKTIARVSLFHRAF